MSGGSDVNLVCKKNRGPACLGRFFLPILNVGISSESGIKPDFGHPGKFLVHH